MHQQEDRSLLLKRITSILQNHEQIRTRTNKGKSNELNQVRIYYYPNADHKFQVGKRSKASSSEKVKSNLHTWMHLGRTTTLFLMEHKTHTKSTISCYNKTPPELRIHLILVVTTMMELVKRNQKISHSNLTCPKLATTYNTTGISTFQIQSCNQCGGQHK